jgi:hypothetical protein
VTPSPPGPSQAVHVVALLLVVVVKADDLTSPTPDVQAQARDISPPREADHDAQRGGARRMRQTLRRLTNAALMDSVRGIAYTTGATASSMALFWLIHH